MYHISVECEVLGWWLIGEKGTRDLSNVGKFVYLSTVARVSTCIIIGGILDWGRSKVMFVPDNSRQECRQV